MGIMNVLAVTRNFIPYARTRTVRLAYETVQPSPSPQDKRMNGHTIGFKHIFNEIAWRILLVMDETKNIKNSGDGVAGG